MPSSRTPNKSRFLEAATIYRDAMVPFIDGVLGSDRIRSHLFSDKARELNRRKYDDGMRSLQQGKPVRELIDHADIPFLIEDNLRHFSGLDRADVSRMHEIRLLWNDKIKHRDELGDFAPEDATEYATHCAVSSVAAASATTLMLSSEPHLQRPPKRPRPRRAISASNTSAASGTRSGSRVNRPKI